MELKAARVMVAKVLLTQHHQQQHLTPSGAASTGEAGTTRVTPLKAAKALVRVMMVAKVLLTPHHQQQHL